MDAPAGIVRDGSRVLIQGLQSMPEAEHNGKHGVIRGAFHSISTGCWPVQVEGHCKLLLALRPENICLAKLQRRCEPRHFSHLVRDGTVTLLGFGSLVSRSSASRSFDFKNFRIGSVAGYQRIFNRSDWINYTWGYSRVETGETCSVALARTDCSVISRIALMDVSAAEGLSGFLHRETTYEIFEVWLLAMRSPLHVDLSLPSLALQVPYVDDDGNSGTALACGECSDDDAQILWGQDNWYAQKALGQCFYVTPPSTPMPMTPERYSLGGDFEGPGYPCSSWMPLTNQRLVMDKASGKFLLPARPWVYPAPGYLQSIYRAHAAAGLADSLLVNSCVRIAPAIGALRICLIVHAQDTTLLMDRITPLRTYLDANPTLKDFVMDRGRFAMPGGEDHVSSW